MIEVPAYEYFVIGVAFGIILLVDIGCFIQIFRKKR